MNLFTDTADYLYIGSQTQKFSELDVWLDTVGSAGTYVWEYSTGVSTWATLSPVTNGTWISTAKISWTPPTNWVKGTVALVNSEPLFYIRCRASVLPTTYPKANFIKRHRPISLFIMQKNVGDFLWNFWNRTITASAYYPNGFCIETLDRVLTPGEPKKYEVHIVLREANY
jgi:hypothetical protein